MPHVSPSTSIGAGLDVLASAVAVAAPERGDGFWAGAPSAVRSGDDIYLAYRLRRPVSEGRGYANVVARSTDGVRFETLCVLRSDRLGCASLERPALVRRPDGGWRIYVSLSTPDSKHWSIDALGRGQPRGVWTAVAASRCGPATRSQR